MLGCVFSLNQILKFSSEKVINNSNLIQYPFVFDSVNHNIS